MKLFSMQLPKPKKGDKHPVECCPANDREKYPWGLRLSLDNASLKLLPEAKDLDVDDTISLEAKAKVIGKHSNEAVGGEADMRVELQITDLGFTSGKSYSKAFKEEANKK